MIKFNNWNRRLNSTTESDPFIQAIEAGLFQQKIDSVDMNNI